MLANNYQQTIQSVGLHDNPCGLKIVLTDHRLSSDGTGNMIRQLLVEYTAQSAEDLGRVKLSLDFKYSFNGRMGAIALKFEHPTVSVSANDALKRIAKSAILEMKRVVEEAGLDGSNDADEKAIAVICAP